MLSKQLLGTDDDHITYRNSVGLQAPVWDAFDSLCLEAKEKGFDPTIASGFRNFERQQLIWNGKACGERLILNDACTPVDIESLNERELLHAMLRFSAIPGTSRHHWGTDFDIYDAAAMPAGYDLQLTSEECCDDGIFAPFHTWLSEYLAQNDSVFFRPYANDHGGIAAELWHLSYAPLARDCQAQAHEDALRAMLSEQDISLRAAILDDFAAIYQHYIDVPAERYPLAWQPGT